MSSYPSLAFLARSLGFGKGKVHQPLSAADADPSPVRPDQPTFPAQHDLHNDKSAQEPPPTISARTASGQSPVLSANEEHIAPSDGPTSSLDLRQNLPAVDSPGYALARQSAVNKVSYLLVTNHRAVDGQALQQLYAESFKDSASNELLDALLRTGVDQSPDRGLEDDTHAQGLTAKQRHEWIRRLGVAASSESNTGGKTTVDTSGVNATTKRSPEALISTAVDQNVERGTVLQSNSQNAEQPINFVQNATSVRSSEDDTHPQQESIIAQKPTVAALPLNLEEEPGTKHRISVSGNKSQLRKADRIQQPNDTPTTPAEQGSLDVRPHSKSKNKYTTTQRRQFKRQRWQELQFKEASLKPGMNTDQEEARLQSERNSDAGRVRTVLIKKDAEVGAARKAARKARKAARMDIKTSRVADRQQERTIQGEATLTKQQPERNAIDRRAGTSTQPQSDRVLRRKERKLRRQQQRREARDAQRMKKKLPLSEKR